MALQSHQVRQIMVVVRLNTTEYEQLKKFRDQTTEKTTSNYLRKLALHKPVTVKYRNASADDFLQSMLELKRELNWIGVNYNQAVAKLHTVSTIPEFRSWIRQYEQDKTAFVTKTADIFSLVQQLHEQWLLK